MIKDQEFHLERQLNLLKEKLVEPRFSQREQEAQLVKERRMSKLSFISDKKQIFFSRMRIQGKKDQMNKLRLKVLSEEKKINGGLKQLKHLSLETQ